jgi:hypothetical protein
VSSGASLPPQALLARLPAALRERYAAFATLPDEARLVPGELLTLGRAVIDAAHGAGDWPRPAGEIQEAVFGLAEKLPFAYHELTDAHFAHLRGLLGDARLVALVIALCLHDAHRRLAIAWPDGPPSPERPGVPPGDLRSR